jgi:O-methyltransferase
MIASIKTAIGSLLSRTPLKGAVCYQFNYNLIPAELAFLVEAITSTKDVPGDIYEVGCFRGNTTCFLNRHLRESGINKDYYCIDTFSGFAEDDMSFEQAQRGKSLEMFSGFRANALKWFERTLAVNACQRVFCIKADVKKYQFVRPVSFALLDVDLYQPTIYALQHMWPHLSPGGMIAVHDCKPENMFDGAFQAYMEFTESQHLPRRFGPGVLGVISKAR